MERTKSSSGGRPRQFDREAALDVALRLFWQRGYEGTSVADLTQALGIAPPSLYAAFGGKADLYRAALRRYESLPFGVDLGCFDSEPNLSEAVRQVLTASVTAVTQDGWARGCMISSGFLSGHPDTSALQDEVRARRDTFRQDIALKLRRWLDATEAEALARYLTAVMQGISVQARDGATADDLGAIMSETVLSLQCRYG